MPAQNASTDKMEEQGATKREEQVWYAVDIDGGVMPVVIMGASVPSMLSQSNGGGEHATIPSTGVTVTGSGRISKPPQRFAVALDAGDAADIVRASKAKSSVVKSGTTSTKANKPTASEAMARQQTLPFGPSTESMDQGVKRKALSNVTQNDKRPKPLPAPHSLKNDDKPVPIGEPFVWTEFRQALCETVPYFNSYQGSPYCSDGHCWGFLLADDCAARLHLDEEIVITRAAGHMGLDSTGKMGQISDHSETDPSVKAVKMSRKKGLAVVLIAGNNNRKMATRMPHQYNVLGYFQVTNIWPEKNGNSLCYKFRFEKTHLKELSWWAPAGASEPKEPDFSIQIPYQQCVSCGDTYIQILERWVCLNAECTKFWTYENGRVPAADAKYNPAFLKKRTEWPEHQTPPYSLRPKLFTCKPTDAITAYSKESWAGMCCPECGCCSSRVEWERWVCPKCGFVHTPPRPVVSATRGAAPLARINVFSGLAVPADAVNPQFVTSTTSARLGDYRLTTYELTPGNFVYHFSANETVSEAIDGADNLFLELQQYKLGLKRHAVGGRDDKLAGLTAHFASNFGLPYKYILAVETRPFQDAPDALLKALQRLRWAGKHVGQSEEEQFNEILAVGYYEQGKMGYHDDGEKGLGPVVATMAFGAPSKMKIRMKAKFYRGYIKPSTQNRSPTFDPNLEVLPGSQLEHSRRELQQQFERKSLPQVTKAWQNIYTKLNKTSQAPDALQLAMNHGDIIIMQGADVQKYYEHQVENLGNIRFALTGRHIKLDSVSSDQHAKCNFDESLFPPYPCIERKLPVGYEGDDDMGMGPPTNVVMPAIAPPTAATAAAAEGLSSQASSSALSSVPSGASSRNGAAADARGSATSNTSLHMSSTGNDSTDMEDIIYADNDTSSDFDPDEA